ncbi:NAD-dependent dehydratase [Burkholderia plantarii]|uniref:NAD-dependent dehydratase n=1 Tax=Burkholderia plantarii TaxID=41899 RepID=UPI0018DC948D|nr:NAD-dependent dehydratase [Burkholderia plantarii]MBI0328681.1 NAD-dependent dehydratase [Burkholderia plantarii]
MKLLLLGATGLVGSRTLQLALSHDGISEVIAPTRKPLAPADKLVNPVGPRIEALLPALMSYKPDAAVCALGTTQALAGSREAFRHVDYELPVVFGKALHEAGVETYAIVTALGSSPASAAFYYRVKGEVERDIQRIGFRSLTICRPSLIGGKRNEAQGGMGPLALTLAEFLGPVLPKKFRVNRADVIASSLLDAVIAAKPGCNWIHAEAMH